MVGGTVHGHAHADAFMLQTYRCPACEHTEKVWNSRDGVTPFMIRCRHCGGEANHIHWHADEYLPDHVPAVGDRIFVDLDPEEALRKRRDYVEQWWDEGETSGGVTVPPMREHPTLGPLGKDGAAAYLANGDMEWGDGTPHLIEVTDAVLDWLARRGGGR